MLWPEETYPADDVSHENLSDAPFADFSLPCPRNPERYLDATFGTDWRNIGRTQDYNHVTRENEVKLAFLLFLYLKSTALVCNMFQSCVMEFEVMDDCEPAHPFR